MRIIMAELNQQKVGFFLQRFGPKPFVYECLGAASTASKIYHAYRVFEIVLDIMSPSATGIVWGIFTNRRVANNSQSQWFLGYG